MTLLPSRRLTGKNEHGFTWGLVHACVCVCVYETEPDQHCLTVSLAQGSPYRAQWQVELSVCFLLIEEEEKLRSPQTKSDHAAKSTTAGNYTELVHMRDSSTQNKKKKEKKPVFSAAPLVTWVSPQHHSAYLIWQIFTPFLIQPPTDLCHLLQKKLLFKQNYNDERTERYLKL